MQERAPNSSCSGAQRGKALAAPPPDLVLRSASDGVRRAPQSACEGYERLGLAFGRGDDRSSTAWCVLALCAAPSLPHPRAREARFRHVPSYRSRARPDMCTTVTTAPPVGPATPPPAQTACTSRGSRERARSMSAVRTSRFRYNSWPGSSFYGCARRATVSGSIPSEEGLRIPPGSVAIFRGSSRTLAATKPGPSRLE